MERLVYSYIWKSDNSEALFVSTICPIIMTTSYNREKSYEYKYLAINSMSGHRTLIINSVQGITAYNEAAAFLLRILRAS